MSVLTRLVERIGNTIKTPSRTREDKKARVKSDVNRILGFGCSDISIGGISLREEISKILNGYAEPAIPIGDTYTLYDYVLLARKSKKWACDNELTDMLIGFLNSRKEMIYTVDGQIGIGKFLL